MIIVKFAQNNKGIIGNNNTIPWHCSQDLKDFKKETFGHAIVMGRKTFESIGNRPLYGRLNIVLSMKNSMKPLSVGDSGRLIWMRLWNQRMGRKSFFVK